MFISLDLFEAYLDCPSKCWFRFNSTEAVNSAYSQLVEKENQLHRKEALKRLLNNILPNDSIVAPSRPLNIKKATWRLAVDFVMQKDNLETRILALERLSLKEKPDQYIPIRNAFSNKVTKREKLLQ